MSTFNPSEYGLTTELTTANLLNGISAYRQAVEKLAGSATPAQALESAVRDQILADTVQQSEVAQTVAKVREIIFDRLFLFPAESVGLFEALADIRSDVKEIRDWHLSRVAKNVRVEIPATAGTSDLQEAATQLGEYVSNIYAFFASDAGKNFPGFNAEEFAQVPTKVSEKTGNVSLKLPRVPGTRKGSGGNVGRGAIYRQMCYFVDGDSVPNGTHLRDVLISYCSDAAHIFTITWVLDELKRTNQEMSSAPGSEWMLTLPNGKTLVGFVPSDAIIEDEDDDSEEDDDQ